MAFRATNVIPQVAYQRARATATNVRANCSSFISQMAAGATSYTLLRDAYIFLQNADADFAALAQTPGLAEYATAQEHDEGYDVAAEFGAMRGAVQAVMTWMSANVPTSVTATAPAQWTHSGPLIATTFSVAQTAPLRTLMQAVVASIE